RCPSRFFFYPSVAPPDLHSFPTRRSSDLDFLVSLDVFSPIQGLKPCIQFRQMEGFGQVIIRSKLQPADFIVQRIFSGYDKDATVDFFSFGKPEDVQAVSVR